jgi:hypothetical protein
MRGRRDWIMKAETIIAVLSTMAMKTPRNAMTGSSHQANAGRMHLPHARRPQTSIENSRPFEVEESTFPM